MAQWFHDLCLVLAVRLSFTAAESLLKLLDRLEDASALKLDQGKWCATQIYILERYINRLDERIDLLEAQLVAVKLKGFSWIRGFGEKLSLLRRLLICKRRRAASVLV